jgi:hypothetical protein
LAAIAYLAYASSAMPDESGISSQTRAIAIWLSFRLRLASAYRIASAFRPKATSALTLHSR